MSFIYDKRMHDINQRKQSLNNIGKQKKKKKSISHGMDL